MILEKIHIVIIVAIYILIAGPFVWYLYKKFILNKWTATYNSIGFCFLLFLYLGIPFYFIIISHTVEEIIIDNTNNLIHKSTILIGSKIFKINNKKIINTDSLGNYTTLVINNTDHNLVIKSVAYSNSSLPEEKPEELYYISFYDFFSFKNSIRFFFLSEPPTSTIKEHDLNNKTEYWLVDIGK